MPNYLVSRPGRPLHLAVWTYHGRPVPLCGQDRGAQWRLTGPWAEKWDRHKGSELCSRCVKVLNALSESAMDALDRAGER